MRYRVRVDSIQMLKALGRTNSCLCTTIKQHGSVILYFNGAVYRGWDRPFEILHHHYPNMPPLYVLKLQRKYTLEKN